MKRNRCISFNDRTTCFITPSHPYLSNSVTEFLVGYKHLDLHIALLNLMFGWKEMKRVYRRGEEKYS